MYLALVFSFSMMEEPILCRFQSKNEDSFYYCLAFGLKLKNYVLPRTSIGKHKLFRKIKEKKVQEGFVLDLKARFPEVTVNSLTDIENSFGIRLNIFSRKINPNKPSRTNRVQLARQSNYGAGDGTIDINLYSGTFDGFSNFSLDRLNFIVDKNRFLQKYNNDTDGKTIFELLAKQVNPDLPGQLLYEKSLEYQQRWNYPTIPISDHRRFFELFGHGLEVWVRLRNRKRVETFKVVGSTRKKTIRICLKGVSQFHEFSIHQLRSKL